MEDIKKDSVTFNSKIFFQKCNNNSNFSNVKIRILHIDKNENDSFISKEVVEEKLIPSLYNIPIVGHFIEENNNFGGHDSNIVRTNEGIKIKDLTVPFGIVPESADVWWENVEEDGESHEYLCCTGLLWTGRYKEAQLVIEKSMNQSMEIDVYEGYKDEKDGLYHITDAEFSALCILGKSDDPDINVEPCFPSSNIVAYSLNKEEFKLQFSEMIEELKKDIEYKNESEEVKLNRDKIISKFSHVKKDEKYNEIIENKELPNDELTTALFSLSQRQLRDLIEEELSKERIIKTYYDGDKYEENKYYLIDIIPDENIVIVECNEDYKIYGISYTKQGDSITLNYKEMKRYIRGDWREFVDGKDVENEHSFNKNFEKIHKEKFNKLNKKIEELEKENINLKNKSSNKETDKFSKEIKNLQFKNEQLEEEIKILREFKSIKTKEERVAKEKEIFEQYYCMKDNEKFKEIKANANKYEKVEDLEKDLALLFVKYVKEEDILNFSKEKKVVKIKLEKDRHEENNDGYGGILKKYCNK